MAQFRNVADIVTEVLLKAGEVSNGNSPYQSRAQTYVNKVHHAIVGGGSILNVNVDEPWVWARSHFPIVIEMQPAFTSGYMNTQQGQNNISFTQMPLNPYTGNPMSVEGWHIQSLNGATVYKIMQHSSGATTAQLDSNFVDTVEQSGFRCFQIDYPIFPAFMYIDSTCDRLDYAENGTAGSTTASLTLSVQHGAYTPTNLATSIAALLNTNGTLAYGASFDTVANTFQVTCSTGYFSLLGASGANTRRSTLPLLGYDQIDQTSAQSFTSGYMPNQIGRMIEPFKMFKTNWWGEHFCYSTDPIKMQEDYPVAQITQRYPDRFARISEDNNGIIWVRFNAYPSEITKLMVDWIPQPIDLQNNTASFTKLPRGDVETLINGAVAMLQMDKNDSNWENSMKLVSLGLDAMKKKNHGMLFRTGQEFGQIVPRSDLNRSVRRLDYGYTINGSTAAIVAAGSIANMIGVPISYMQFQATSTVASVTAATVPNNVTLFALILQLTQSFTGSGISGLSLNVGTQANPTQFINGFNVGQGTSASSQASQLLLYFPAVSTPIIATLTATGANLANLKQGTATMFLQETNVP